MPITKLESISKRSTVVFTVDKVRSLQDIAKYLELQPDSLGKRGREQEVEG